MPTARDEAWKYSPPPPVFSLDLLRPCAGQRSPAAAATAIENAIQLSFVDGRITAFDPPKLPKGVVLAPISQQLQTDPEWVRRLLSTSTPDKTRGLLAVNMAHFTDGLLLYVPHGVRLEKPIVMNTATGKDARAHLRVLVQLESGAEATILHHSQSGENSITTHVHELDIGPDARLHHYRLQRDDATAHHLAFTENRVADGATLDHCSFTLGAAWSRHEITTHLLGENAAAQLNAVAMLNGAQHGDFTSIIHHSAPHCQSRQTVRNVLDDRSRGVFQGKIHVHQIAQKTDGYQMNQALLLSPSAEMDSKPELEIYADDVKCSHGATVGQLSEDALFYMQSRGMDAATARALLTQAFAREVLDMIGHDDLRHLMLAAMEETHADRRD
jgi:Fe-S cluster assembly protein SufD